MRSLDSTREAEVVHALRALHDAEAQVETPPHVEAAVMAAWDADAARTSSAVSRPWLRTAAALAAGLVLAASLSLLGSRLAATLATTAPAASPGTVLLVGEPILAGEHVRIVRMRLPTSTLTALGVRSAAGDLAEAVDVDVIVGEDGVARAIRFGM